MLRRLVILCFSLAALVGLKAATAADFAIHAGAVVDPSSGNALRDQWVIVADGRIAAIGPHPAIPAGARTIDLGREWLLPGLIDAHTHLTLTVITGDAPFESFYLAESTALRGMRGLRNAHDLLNAGFTSVRDVGNAGDYAMQDVRRAIDEGWFEGPTIIDAGKIIAPYGGQSRSIPSEQGAFWRYEYLDADGPAEIRKAVRTNLYHGAGVIKLVLDNFAYHYSVDEIRAAVDEAHRAHVPVAVHVFGGEAADNAIEAGVDSIEHGFFLTDAELTRMKEKGIYLVCTEYPRAHLDIVGTAGGLFPEPAAFAAQIIDRLRRAHRIGVRLVFGTDVSIEMPKRTRADLMFDYLDSWRAAGVSPREILASMTVEAAKLLRIDAQRGRLEVGLAADLIAVPADPLADVGVLRRVDFVMKDGRVIRGAASAAQ